MLKKSTQEKKNWLILTSLVSYGYSLGVAGISKWLAALDYIDGNKYSRDAKLFNVNYMYSKSTSTSTRYLPTWVQVLERTITRLPIIEYNYSSITTRVQLLEYIYSSTITWVSLLEYN